MKSVFSSDPDDQSNLFIPNNTYKVVDIIKHTPRDILICEKEGDPRIVAFTNTSVLTRQETDGSGYYTSLTGEVVEVDPS